MKANPRRTISRFLNDPARTQVVYGELAERYRAMALDEAREREVRASSEGLIGGLADEPR